MVALVRRDAPQEMQALEQALTRPTVGLQDVATWLSRLAAAPSLSTLEHEAKLLLTKEPGSSTRRLHATLRALVRKLLLNYRERDLTKLLERTFAEAMMTWAATVTGLDARTRRHLNGLLVDNWCARADGAASSLEQLEPRPRATFTRLMDKVRWINSAWRMQTELAALWSDELKQRFSPSETDNPIASLLGDASALGRLSAEVERKVVEITVRQAFAVLLERGASGRNGIADWELELVEAVAAVGLFEPDSNLLPADFHPNVIDLVVLESTEQALLFGIGRFEAAQRLAARSSSATIGRQLTKSLSRFADDVGFEWRDEHDESLITLSAQWMASKGVHRLLARLLRPVIRRELPEISRSPSSVIAGFASSSGLDALWREWESRLPVIAREHPAVVRHLPWSRLSAGGLRTIIQQVFTSLSSPQREYAVTFRVGGVAPQGPMWRCANIDFYDPERFNFGENPWLLPSRLGPGATHARVVVTADTREAAVRVARADLVRTLSTLAFALSVDVSVGGLRTVLDPETWVVDLTDLSWSGGWSRSRADLADVADRIDERISEFAEAYSPLLQAASRGSMALTELQEGFLRAVQWYRRGRWERDASERFLFYWIALEHLGRKPSLPGDRWLQSLAEMEVGWRDVLGGWWFFFNVRPVSEAIRSDAALRARVGAVPLLSRWDRDLATILHPQALRSLARLAQGTEASSHIRRLSLEVARLRRSRAAFENRLKFECDLKTFRLRLLYDYRNATVHHGLTARPDAEFLAEELEQHIESVLKRLSRYVVEDPPTVPTMDAFLKADPVPWLA
jgi:hypothetical protein